MSSVTGVILMIMGVMVGSNLVANGVVFAAEPPALIVGIQTASTVSASEEYIIIANNSAAPLDLSGVKLEYYPAKPKQWGTPSRVIPLHGNLAVGQKYQLASNGYMEGSVEQNFSSTLASAGGHLRLIGPSEEWDVVGWGTAQYAKGQPAPAPKAGQLLTRRLSNGHFVDSGNNMTDFTPQTEEPEPSETYEGIIISELFPDPTPPNQDATDEFIEVQNNSDRAVQLRGLQLVVGASMLRRFILPESLLEAGTQKAFFATQTKLVLSNSGSTVQLISPHGRVLDTVTYPKALANMAWARNIDSWVWTAQPSPDRTNIFKDLNQPSAKPKAAIKPKSNTKKPKTTKKTSVKSATTQQPALATVTSEQKRPVHNSVIAGVGLVAVLYGAYEYRHDVIHLYRKLRGNRKTG